jgi:DNA-binding FadR family transcriptional regulator
LTASFVLTNQYDGTNSSLLKRAIEFVKFDHRNLMNLLEIHQAIEVRAAMLSVLGAGASEVAVLHEIVHEAG